MSRESKALLRVCAICGFNRGEFLLNQGFVLPDSHPLRNGYDVVCCEACDFLFADSAVSQADYDVYYSDFSKYEDNHTSTGGGETDFDAVRIKYVAKEIEKLLGRKSARILDIGCANGGILKELKALGFEELVGVDPSTACVNHIRENLSIESHRASLFNIPGEIGKFDLIILSHVLEHILDLKESLQRVGSFLKPGGMIYVEVPDAMRYVDFITSPFQDFNTEHINHFTEISLNNLFLNSGFEKVAGGAKTIESAPGIPYPALFAFYRKGAPIQSAFLRDSKIHVKIRRYIHYSQEVINRIDEFLKVNFTRDEIILVWGTGQLTLKLLAMSELRNFKIRNFIDSNPVLRNKQLKGIRIIHPEDMQMEHEKMRILITSTIHEQSIKMDIVEKYKLKNPVLGLGSCLN